MSTAPKPATIARELERICGAEHVRIDEASRQARTVDGVVPQVVVAPATAEETAAVLKFSAERDLVVVPAGSFSRQHIGRVPPRIDVVLETARMNAVQYYEPGDLTIGVQAGAKLSEVLALVDVSGQTIPIDPPSASSASLGGVIATAAAGPLRHGYGTIRDFCLGVQFATADGNVAKAGGRVVKNVAGYDVTKLMVGSYGTLAVITSVNLRVFPRPRHTRTFVAQFNDAEDVLAARDRVLLHSPLTLLALEILCPNASRMLTPQFSQHAWMLLMRAAGSDNVLARYRNELGTMITWETEGESEARLWRAIADYPDTFSAREPNAIVLRVAVPQQRLLTVLEAGIEAADAYGFTYACSGRATSPTLLMFTPVSQKANYAAVVASVRTATGTDGSAVVTHCPTFVKRNLDVWGTVSTDVDCMKAIKRTLDPCDVLNRGRFLL